MPRAAVPSLVASLLLHAAIPLSAVCAPTPRRFLAASLVEIDVVSAPANAAPRGAAHSAAAKAAALHSAAPEPQVTNPARPAARAPKTVAAAASNAEPLAPSRAVSVAALSAAVAVPTAPDVALSAVIPPPAALVAASTAAAEVPAADGAGRRQFGAVAAGSANGALALGAVPGAGSGSGLGSPQLDAERARYLAALRARVAAHREYPYLARRAGLEGTVCLRVSVTAAGQVSELHATCGASASALLDSALRAVRAAAPFGPLPPVLGAALTVDVPIVFQLDEASATN